MLDKELFIGLYIILAVVSIVNCLLNISVKIAGIKKNKKEIITVIFVSFLISVLAMLRPYNSPDTMAYLNAYLQFFDTKTVIFQFGTRFEGMEVGFLLFLAIMKDLGLSFRAVLFVISFLNAFLILYACKELGRKYIAIEPNLNCLIAIFLSLFGYHYCCIAIRSGLGLGLGLLGCAGVIDKFSVKKYLGVILIGIACFIHSMSIVLIIPLVFMLCKKNLLTLVRGWLIIASILCILSLTFNLGEPIIDIVVGGATSLLSHFNIMGFTGYLAGTDNNVGLKDWLIVVNTLILLLILTKSANETKNLPIIISVGIYIMAFLYPIRAINRLADYFFIFLLPLFSSLNMAVMSKWSIFYVLVISNFAFLLYLMNL